jgi:hypothetical protein
MSSEAEQTDAWTKWADHWRFSNLTTFRVPEYLATVLGAWRQVSSRLLDSDPDKPPHPIHFVRHALIDEDDASVLTLPTYEGGIKAEAQFTQSALLATLLSNRKSPAEDFRKRIEDLKLKLAAIDWNLFIDRIKGDAGSAYSELEINYDLLRSLPECEFSDEELPVLFGNLFLAYASASHVGYLVHHLNNQHFRLSPADRDKRLAYLISLERSDGAKLDRVKEIRPVNLDHSLGSSFDCGMPQHEAIWMLGSEKGEAKQLSKVFECLWATLNEPPSTTKPLSWHLAVPVSAWSEAPKTPNGDTTEQTDVPRHRTHRHRAGALLGWAFHQFEESEAPPAGWPLSSEEPLDAALYQHVRSLCFMMEDFAANYLAGETEWALARPWSNNDTPESFMKANFHHSCGWECVAVASGSANQAYFRWKSAETLAAEDAELQSLLNKKPVWAGKQLLAVNLTLKLSVGVTASAATSKIAYLLPSSLCLSPSDSRALDDYLASIAERVRMFYDRALERGSDLGTGAKVIASSFLHEIRNLGESVAGSWLINLTAQARDSVNACWTGSYEDLKATDWKLAPFPEFFDSMADAFGVWGRQDVFQAAGGSKRLGDITSKAVDVAVSCVLLRFFRGKPLAQSAGRKFAREDLKAIRDVGASIKQHLAFSLKKHRCADLQLEGPNQDAVGAFKRLLVRLVVEAVIHAKPDSVSLQLAPDHSRDRWILNWSNTTLDPTSYSIHSFRSRLPSDNLAITLDLAARGMDVLDSLVVQLEGESTHNFSDKDAVEKHFCARSIRITLNNWQEDASL